MTTGEEPRRVRVVFVLPSFVGGGAERVVVTFANALPRDRFQVALVVLSGEGPFRSLVDEHVRVFELGIPRISRALPKLMAVLRGLGPDVVMASAPHVSMALLASPWLLPERTLVVVREANLPSLMLPSMRPRPVFAAGYRWLYPRAAVVFATSERMREELIARGSRDQLVVVLPNPVDLERIRNLANPPTRVPGQGRRFVAVGRLVPQKGFDRLLPAFAGLPSEDHLTILGEGSERAALEQQIDALGLTARVAMPGFAHNPWTWMAGADALLMPSRTEGMPNAALESLACGTPVIATEQSGGLPEVARQVPTGELVVVDPADLGAAMLRVAVAPPWPRASVLPAAFRIVDATESLAEWLERISGS